MRHAYRLLVDVADGQDPLTAPTAGMRPHLVDVGRTGAARERRAGRAVRRAEGDLGEALAVLLVEPDQAVQFVLYVVDLCLRGKLCFILEIH